MSPRLRKRKRKELNYFNSFGDDGKRIFFEICMGGVVGDGEGYVGGGKTLGRCDIRPL